MNMQKILFHCSWTGPVQLTRKYYTENNLFLLPGQNTNVLSALVAVKIWIFVQILIFAQSLSKTLWLSMINGYYQFFVLFKAIMSGIIRLTGCYKGPLVHSHRVLNLFSISFSPALGHLFQALRSCLCTP